MKDIFSKYKSEISISLIVVIFNIFFTSMPLVNLLSYESSTLNAVLFSLISGIYWLVKKELLLIKRIKFLSFLLIIPIIILSISTILCQHCPLNDGLYFYLVIAAPAIFVGASIAEYSNYISTKLKYFLFAIIWILIISGFLTELYFNPQIYFYNPIFGYYPGVIYDQGIEITADLILYRIINLIFSIGIIVLFCKKSYLNKLSKHIVIIIVIAIYLIFFIGKSFTNFSTNLNRIKSELTNTISTQHFEIIAPDSLSESEIKILEYEHEFNYEVIKEKLNSDLDEKITSIIFETGAQKKRLFGSANADVAKPWLNQIYMNYDNYRFTVKHETAHIFSANFSSGIFKVPSNFNPGMIEGFAMAVENNYDEYSIHYLAALAYKNNYKISLKELFTNFTFFSNASSISYIYAGSFLKYLSEKYDWDKIKQIYLENDFGKVFNIPIIELEKQYYEYLQTLQLNNNKNAANYYFGRIPLIKKYCARATAKELTEASDLYFDGYFLDASNLYQKIYNYSGTYSALVGYSQSIKSMGNLKGSIDFIENNLEKFNGSAYYYYLEFLLADFSSLNNDSSKAAEYFSKIIEQNPHTNYLRSAEIRKRLLTENDSVIINYINNENSRESKIIELAKIKPNDRNLQLLASFREISVQDNIERKLIFENVETKLKLSPRTYFEISKYFYKNLDIEPAIRFAELSLKNVGENRKSVFAEHLKKLKWIQKKSQNSIN